MCGSAVSETTEVCKDGKEKLRGPGDLRFEHGSKQANTELGPIHKNKDQQSVSASDGIG